MYEHPAFPTLERGTDGLELSSPGMTLRDYFAARSMAVLQEDAGNIFEPCEIAQMSYEMADAMMAEREKGSAQK